MSLPESNDQWEQRMSVRWCIHAVPSYGLCASSHGQWNFAVWFLKAVSALFCLVALLAFREETKG